MSIYDASWIRLREVTLSYSFPSALVSRLGLGDLTVQASGRNLWLSTQYWYRPRI